MALSLKNVSLRVDGQTHIYDTTVELAPAGFNILLGTTLAGKTSLMRLMAGLVQPTSGEIWFKGANVTGIPVQKRNVSMVYQQFINYPNMNVFDNIASPLKLAGHSRAEIRKRVGPVAELAGGDGHLRLLADRGHGRRRQPQHGRSGRQHDRRRPHRSQPRRRLGKRPRPVREARNARLNQLLGRTLPS